MKAVRSITVGLVAILGLSLVFAAGSASAKQVYDYVYSGESIDGSGSERGVFPAQLGGVAYDEEAERLVVLVGSTESGESPPPSYISRFTKAGAPSPFGPPALGDTIVLPKRISPTSDVAIDDSGGPGTGNVYVFGLGSSGTKFGFAFQRDGTVAAAPNLSTLFNPCGIATDPDGNVWVPNRNGYDGHAELFEYTSSGEPTGVHFDLEQYEGGLCNIAIDSKGNFYGVEQRGFGAEYRAVKVSPTGEELMEFVPWQTTAITGFGIDSSNNDVYVGKGAFASTVVTQYTSEGFELNTFGAPDPGHSFAGLEGGARGIAVDPVTHDVWVTNTRSYSGARHLEKFVRTPANITVPTVIAAPIELNPTAVTFHGSVNADGVETISCSFEWGTTQALGSVAPCAEGGTFTGSSDHPVSANIAGLTKGTTYFYRLSATNGNGRRSSTATIGFKAQGKAILSSRYVNHVNTDGVQLNAEIDPNGGHTTYHFEWEREGHVFSSPETLLVHPVVGKPEEEDTHNVPDLLEPRTVSTVVTGLSFGSTYAFRVVITNQAGVTTSEDAEFKTYLPDPSADSCGNAAVRRQTEASLLLDCRAYELVSAVNTGGYDVESSLVPGQSPFDGYPRADEAVLYGLHFGSIPGIAGSPTNLGIDPYLAVRGPNGWATGYVGLPADGMSEVGPFGSPLLEADSSLHRFAFGGIGICSPCFEDGSSNIPLRQPDGSIGKGMAGSRSPAGNPNGFIGRRFSADGNHFVFGSIARFETAAKNGDETIYDRNLNAGTTQVVSTLPDGSVMPSAGGEPGELGISADGSRIVVGQEVSTDAAGNTYWHLYMHVGSSPNSLDLTPGASTQALYAGMTEDGSEVFFTTTSKLLPLLDTDESADLYEADVNAGGVLSLQLLSSGTPPPVGNSNACNPVANANGNNWNAVGAASPDSCGVVAVGGGGGVASDDGIVYFFSPETLDGSGTPNQPNLFVVRPGQAPHLVGTLEPGNPAVLAAVKDSEVHRYGDFQVSPNGRYAAFDTSLPLLNVANFGHSVIYRYDADGNGGTGALICASCAPTGAALGSDSSLPAYGLALTDEGNVFFTTQEPFVLRDTNERTDAYEWENGAVELVSTGQSADGSALLSVSADGRDAYFFTRQILVHDDENGNAVKIYDARKDGGYPYDPAPFPCAASDECHGPGTQAPPAPNIITVTGSGRKSEVETRRRKRPHKHRHHKARHDHRHRHGGGRNG